MEFTVFEAAGDCFVVELKDFGCCVFVMPAFTGAVELAVFVDEEFDLADTQDLEHVAIAIELWGDD